MAQFSEWLQIMLGEIARKREEREQALRELEQRERERRNAAADCDAEARRAERGAPRKRA